MKVVIFGATGRTGRYLVERALGAGHEVGVFVRDPARLEIPDGRLKVFRGDVGDGAAVRVAVTGRDAVLSALGHTKTSSKDVQTVGTENIVEAMKERGVPRLVSLTGAGVRVPEDRPKLVDRAFGFLLGRLQPDVLEDAERHAEVIRGSGLDWVIVRAPRLTGEAARGRYRVGYVGKNSGTRISRADVADFMLEQITGDDYLHRMPMVSY